MADPATSPAGGAPSSDPSSGGAKDTLTKAEVQKMLDERDAAARAAQAELEQRLAKQAEDHQNHLKRLKKEAEPVKVQDPALLQELESQRARAETLENDMREIKARAKSDRLEAAIARGTSTLTGLRDGAVERVTAIIRASITEDSKGNAVVVVDGRQVLLSEHLKQVQADPFWQAASNRGGGGRQADGALPLSDGGKKQIYADDHAAFNANIDEIAKGNVIVVPRK